MRHLNSRISTEGEEGEKIENAEGALDKLQKGLDHLRDQLKDIKALLDQAKRQEDKQDAEDDTLPSTFSVAI